MPDSLFHSTSHILDSIVPQQGVHWPVATSEDQAQTALTVPNDPVSYSGRKNQMPGCLRLK